MEDFNIYLKNNIEPITKREFDVLKLVAKGKTNHQIAQELQITIYTVKAHVSSLIYKLKVKDRLKAAMKAIELELI